MTNSTGSAERREAARALREHRRLVRADLGAWCAQALAPLEQAPAAHHRLLIARLQALADGQGGRLMVQMPPGSAKSSYASVLFPAWYLARHPRHAVITVSHTHALAMQFGRGVRNLLAEHGADLGVRLAADDRAAQRFALTAGGSYFTAGVFGPITGRRADLVVIDDPVRGRREADRASHREALWRWYASDLVSRLKPGGRVVLVMTRWHQDDLAGRLREQPSARPWDVLELPALAEEGDPLGRAPGAALWPEWENEAALAEKREAVGERAWAALYQQRPFAVEGRLFKPRRIPVLDASPPCGAAVRAWDLAATAPEGSRDPDWTVGLRLARAESGAFVVQDVVRLRAEAGEVVQAIMNTARADGPGVTVALPRDPGQAGAGQVQFLASRLAGYRVVSSPESGAKETRAMPVASQADVGNLLVLRAPWTPALIEELRDFPGGRKDDQVDALSRAFATLIDAPAPARRVASALLSR